jgi:NAD(P)-dependent dehydrogenase (short-subunit alcohol dehydrogenase family)
VAQSVFQSGQDIFMTQTVVITGASAGTARATARLFGARGANVALIARGQAGLDGAAQDVVGAGGRALAGPADVADHAQVEQAAAKIAASSAPCDAAVETPLGMLGAVTAATSAGRPGSGHR